MNIINWSKVKQELPSIFLLSAFEVWWSLNYQSHFYFGKIGSFLTCILSIALIAFLFSIAESFEEMFSSFKDEKKVAFLLAAPFVLGLFWYKDFYHMSNIYYIILYAYYALFLYLFYRAAYRNASSIDTHQF